MGILTKPSSLDEPVIIIATSILLRVEKVVQGSNYCVEMCIAWDTYVLLCKLNWQAYVTMSWACNSISKCCTKLLAMSTFLTTWETGKKCVSMIQWNKEVWG